MHPHSRGSAGAPFQKSLGGFRIAYALVRNAQVIPTFGRWNELLCPAQLLQRFVDPAFNEQ